MCLGAQKNRLIQTVLLNTHNICIGWEIRKIIFWYPLLSGGLSHASYPYLKLMQGDHSIQKQGMKKGFKQ